MSYVVEHSLATTEERCSMANSIECYIFFEDMHLVRDERETFLARNMSDFLVCKNDPSRPKIRIDHDIVFEEKTLHLMGTMRSLSTLGLRPYQNLQ